MTKIILDTNVVVSAFLKPDSLPELIFNMVRQDLFTLCLSDEIFDEYLGVLARRKFKSLDQKQVKMLLLDLWRKAHRVTPQVTVEVIKNDPADNKFLECALAAEADFLITGNTQHFPFKKFRHTKVVTPREFISRIADEIFD